MENSINEKIKKLVNWRREFHKYAETGWTEFRTTSKIAEALNSLGYKVFTGCKIIEPASVMGRPDETIIRKNIDRALEQGASSYWIERMAGYTGVVGILDTGTKGPSIAFRFDIDANDMDELQAFKHKPFREGYCSVNKAAAHCCGHDGHTAVGLVLAEVLASQKERLTGKLILVFQPAEEGVRGAKSIIDKGFLDSIDYFFSGHIGMGVPEGEVRACKDGFFCTIKLDAEYSGKAAHAGKEPNEGNNALLAAATAVLNLHAIGPHKDGASRINVGILEAGTGRNVIPSKASLKLETRGETKDINSYVYNRAVKILKAAAEMYDVQCHLSKAGEAVECTSDETLIDIAEDVAVEINTIKAFKRSGSLNCSEDVSFMINKVQENGGKALYLLFGTELQAGHHNEAFDFDEAVLETALNLYEKLAFKVMCSDTLF